MRISDWSSDVCSSDLMRSNKIEQIFLIGDQQEYVTAILVPNKELMMQTFGLGEDFFQDPDLFIHDEKIISWMKEDIRSLSSELAKFERIKNFALKRTPFTIDDGEMTRSDEHTSEIQSLMRITYAVLCLKKKNT